MSWIKTEQYKLHLFLFKLLIKCVLSNAYLSSGSPTKRHMFRSVLLKNAPLIQGTLPEDIIAFPSAHPTHHGIRFKGRNWGQGLHREVGRRVPVRLLFRKEPRRYFDYSTFYHLLILLCPIPIPRPVCHLLGDYLEGVKKDFEKASKVYRSTCDDYGYSKSCLKYGKYAILGKGGNGQDGDPGTVRTNYFQWFKFLDDQSIPSRPLSTSTRAVTWARAKLVCTRD